jgi:hypothetical protein
MKKKSGVQVLSPDGITIEFGSFYYENMKDAKKAFERWKSRFEQQGYYSSNNGRIPLDELESYCQFKTLTVVSGKNDLSSNVEFLIQD